MKTGYAMRRKNTGSKAGIPVGSYQTGDLWGPVYLSVLIIEQGWLVRGCRELDELVTQLEIPEPTARDGLLLAARHIAFDADVRRRLSPQTLRRLDAVVTTEFMCLTYAGLRIRLDCLLDLLPDNPDHEPVPAVA